MDVPTRSNRAWWWKYVKAEGNWFECTCKDCNYRFKRDSTNPSATGGKHFVKKHADQNPAIKLWEQLYSESP